MKMNLYLKASGAYKGDDGRDFLWSNLREGVLNKPNPKSEQSWHDEHRVADNIRYALQHTLCLLHDTKDAKKRTNSRLEGVGFVAKTWTRDNRSVVVRKIIALPRPIPRELIVRDNLLKKSAPFSKGSDRCPVTKLTDAEWKSLRRIILLYNPQIERSLTELETFLNAHRNVERTQ